MKNVSLCLALLVGLGVRAEVAHQVHLVQQVEVDGEVVETIDLMPYTGDGFTTSNATARAGYIFTHWSTSVVQDFASRDPWGRAYEQVAFSLYEPMTNTAHYVSAVLDADGDGLPDGLELYWYGTLDPTPTCDTDGDGVGFVRELEQGTDPHFPDTYGRGVLAASAQPLFCKLILRSAPEGALFETVTNSVVPGTSVRTDAYEPTTSAFAYWTATGAAVATRDAFGRALDRLVFEMPTNDVELVAECRTDAAARHSLYWYGDESTDRMGDTDGDGVPFAEEVRQGTNPLFPDAFVRGVMRVSARPLFSKLILRSAPEGVLFATVTNSVAPGVTVRTDSYDPSTSAFACWTVAGVSVSTRDAFGRALDRLAFEMPTNDVEIVAIATNAPLAQASLYWYGVSEMNVESDTDGDGVSFAEEVRQGTNPLFPDAFVRGVMRVSARPLFSKLILRSAPEGVLFATVTNSVAPGVTVRTDSYDPSTSAFACWTVAGVSVSTRDAFGRALDRLAFEMPTNDVVLVAECRTDAVARQSLYWYGNETTDGTSDTDGDGVSFAEEVRLGTNPHFSDAFSRGVMSRMAGLDLFACVIRSEPEGKLFETVVRNVGPGVRLMSPTGDSRMSAFAGWYLNGVRQADAFGRALDAVSFEMPTNDVELVARATNAPLAQASLYWYGVSEMAGESDTDGDGVSFAEEVLQGTNPLLADVFSRGVVFALSEELEADLQPFEQMRGAIVGGEYVELFMSGLAGNAATSVTFGENASPLAVDVDGDGLFDLLVVSRGGLQLFLNKGSAANPDFSSVAPGDAWANFRRLLQDMARPLVCSAGGVFYVSDGGGAIFAFSLVDGLVADTGLVGVPAVLDGHLVALTAAGALASNGLTITLDTPVIGGVSVATADIDADGRTDVLVSDLVGHIWLYRNVTATWESKTGVRKFKLLHKVWAGTGEGFAEGMTISLVDWDEDGDQDVLIGTPSGKLMLLRDPRTGRPTNVQAMTGADNVLLTWDPNSQPRIRGYNVYRAPDAESYLRIVNQTPLPTYRDCPGVLRDYWYRVTGVSRFYIAGNSTPTVHESLPTDAVYVQFRPRVWLTDTSGFTGSNVTVAVSMNNSMGISAENLAFGFTYDPAVLEPCGMRTTGLTEGVRFETRGTGGEWRFVSLGGTVATGAGRFLLLDFRVRPVHDVSETTVTLTAATVKTLDGRTMTLDVPQSARIAISDSNPLVPAIVAVRIGDASVASETAFELPVTVTSTESLTNFGAAVTWDAALLELRGVAGATLVGGGAEGVARLCGAGGDFALSLYAKDPASSATNFAARVGLADISAVDVHGFAVGADDAAGAVLIRNANPWVPATVTVSTENRRVETRETVTVPFAVTSDAALRAGRFVVDWDTAALELQGDSGLRGSGRAEIDATGDFSLTFLARDQHTISQTQVRLTSAEVTDVHGFTVRPTVPVVSTVLIRDSNPLVPAIVAVRVGDVSVASETAFELPVTVTSTESLTNFEAEVTWDAALLELRGVAGATLVGGGSEGVARLCGAGGDFALSLYAKDPASSATNFAARVGLADISAVDVHGFTVGADDAAGAVLIRNVNPWMPATVRAGVVSVRTDTCAEFEMPVTFASSERLTNMAAMVAWDADVLELRGVGGDAARIVGGADGTARIAGGGGDFALTFYAKDQHAVSRTDVRLSDMTVLDAHGFVVGVEDTRGAVLIRDSNPPVPAGVVLNVSPVSSETMRAFTVPIPVTSTKVLTNLSFLVGWDANVLELRGASGGAFIEGDIGNGSARIGARNTVPSTLYLTFYAKDQHTVTETAVTLGAASAVCIDGLAAKVTTVDGTIRLLDANVPVPVEMAVATYHARVSSGASFKVPVGATTSGDLATLTVDVAWDDALLTFDGCAAATRVETLAANRRRLVFACTGNYNLFNLDFTAAAIAGLQSNAWTRVVAASGVGGNGLAAVVTTELPRTGTIMIVREVGRYDPGDLDGDGTYTDNDQLILTGYVTYLKMQQKGANFANIFANGYQQQYGVDVRLSGSAARAADVNGDGQVTASDISMLEMLIAEAEGAGK